MTKNLTCEVRILVRIAGPLPSGCLRPRPRPWTRSALTNCLAAGRFPARVRPGSQRNQVDQGVPDPTMRLSAPTNETKYLLGIDMGTASNKGVLATASGAIVATSTIKHFVTFLRPCWAEVDADEVWRASVASWPTKLSSRRSRRLLMRRASMNSASAHPWLGGPSCPRHRH